MRVHPVMESHTESTQQMIPQKIMSSDLILAQPEQPAVSFDELWAPTNPNVWKGLVEEVDDENVGGEDEVIEIMK